MGLKRVSPFPTLCPCFAGRAAVTSTHAAQSWRECCIPELSSTITRDQIIALPARFKLFRAEKKQSSGTNIFIHINVAVLRCPTCAHGFMMRHRELGSCWEIHPLD